jgi:uncharacterized protein (TIGR02246 family)
MTALALMSGHGGSSRDVAEVPNNGHCQRRGGTGIEPSPSMLVIFIRPPQAASEDGKRHGGAKSMLRIILIASVCLLAVGVARAQDHAEIEKLNAHFAELFNKGDAAGVAAMYTEDAVVLPPGGALVKGRNDIQAFWKKAAETLGNAKLTTIDVKPLGPAAARETGYFSLRTKTSPPQEVAGKYVVVWEKIGSEWKLSADIWNDGK